MTQRYDPALDAAATDPIWRRDEIESPCVKVCILHPQAKICVGCLRTGDEIAGWSRMSPDRRREIMGQLSSREPALRAPENRPSARRRDRRR
ncbi:DUF1289 domain-containing protein [Albimonas sp. CAU 1670]|uniref:DUF1289 domain-containing protein n=1 Tax=Albimonas sp. CAU 1670 TaxID=3032599 RepID=UPI0023DAFFBA|nr:DUF1289 domain-containing protein [Albimonas sp. CAU 1670]MDF2234063.1 DUF1289 domain-containing protein [Albimonas sp. CAU 1670]